jgi:hypothetical protein
LATIQVKLEDVFPMVAGQNMGSPFSHSAHVYQGRLATTIFATFKYRLKCKYKYKIQNTKYCRLNYILGYHTTYVETPRALQLRDETMALLRMAVEHWLLFIMVMVEHWLFFMAMVEHWLLFMVMVEHWLLFIIVVPASRMCFLLVIRFVFAIFAGMFFLTVVIIYVVSQLWSLLKWYICHDVPTIAIRNGNNNILYFLLYTVDYLINKPF